MASAILSSLAAIAGKLAGPILGSFSASASRPVPDVSSIEDDLRHLTRTLLRIQAVLADAEEREIHDASIKLWLRELKTLAFHADDVLDEYNSLPPRLHLRHKRKLDELRDSAPAPLAGDSFLRSFADRIHTIVKMFDEIAKEKEALHLREEDGERRLGSSWKPSPTSSMLGDSRIFGREADKRRITELLMAPGEPHVIAIVGIGGIGKTTIAQLVYNDELVRGFFDARAWICASSDFDEVKMTKEIIRAIGHSPGDTTELAHLQMILANALEESRFLLVLDDVCNERLSLWESLRAPLRHASVSKVMVTTRSHSVADVMASESRYLLGLLSDRDCEQLFRQYACLHDGHATLGRIGREIAAKCKGLPLAAKTLGSLLRFETSEERWKEILDSESWEMMDENKEILPILKLSYQRMPRHLKQCFVYCGVFPKSYVFEKDYMVKLWMAQGYIRADRKALPEDIGGAYFDDLVRRSMFQPSQFHYGKDGCFVMHDLILDLARSVSGNECAAIEVDRVTDMADDVFHASMAPTGDKNILKFPALDEPKALRTLLVPKLKQSRDVGLCIEVPNSLFSKLRRLRTLDLSCTNLEQLPDSVGGLVHLRYIGLRETNIRTLPGSVCSLHNLQVLDLGRCEHLTELPGAMGNLTSLRHLKLPVIEDSHVCMPSGIGKLTALQTLSVFYAGGDGWHCGKL